jgi:hypothetical protein
LLASTESQDRLLSVIAFSKLRVKPWDISMVRDAREFARESYFDSLR